MKFGRLFLAGIGLTFRTTPINGIMWMLWITLYNLQGRSYAAAPRGVCRPSWSFVPRHKVQL